MLGPQLQGLWGLWTGSGLASMGIFAGPAAGILTVLAWRGRKWSGSGTWWGLGLCAVTLSITAFVKGYGMPVLLSSGGMLHLLPVGLLIFLYVSSVVLLFAGYVAYRLALFPIALLLLVNPAPNVFISLSIFLCNMWAPILRARSQTGWVCLFSPII